MTHVSLAHLFTAGRSAASIVARQDGPDIPFERFAADVAAARDRVSSSGAGAVAVLADNAYRFAVGVFGALHAGARAVIPPNGLPETIAAVAPHVELLLADRAVGEVVPFRAIPRDSAPPGSALGNIDPKQAVIEFFTSGTTGAPKRVGKSLWEIDHDLRLFDRTWGAALAGRTIYSTVPFLHFFGLTFQICWPLAGGRPFWVDVDEFWETLLSRDTAGAILVTSPGHLLRLAGVPPLVPQRRFGFIYAGGAPLPLAAINETKAILGVLPIEMLGSTETGPMGTRQQNGPNEPWHPMPGLSIMRNAQGCAVVSWPDEPDMPPFETADLIDILPDGRFHLLGRADLIVKIEGKRLSLPEVEAALGRSPLVSDCAVIDLEGIPARLAAAIVLSDDGKARLAEIGAFRLGRLLRRSLADTLEAAAQPKRWRFVDELPRRALGKRDSRALRALFERKGSGTS